MPKTAASSTSTQEQVVPLNDLLHAERRLAELEAELKRLRGEPTNE
jgi:hypothetical protein